MNRKSKKPDQKPLANTRPIIYGLLAKFETPEALVDASKRLYEAGYREYDAYTPYPVEGLAHSMRLKSSPLPYLIFAGGVLGAIIGIVMQWFAQVIDYPQNIGGRPMFSWPAYIPITFELVILLAAFAGVFGLFFFTRFPQPYHPVFRSEDFNAHASTDGFYLGVEAKDPLYDPDKTRSLIEGLGAVQVSEIEV